LLFCFFLADGFSQNLNLKITSKDSVQHALLQSILYQNNKLNNESISKQIDSITNQLQLYGFFNLKLDTITKSDSTYVANYFLGHQYKKIRIYYINDEFIKQQITQLKIKSSDTYFDIDTKSIPNLLENLVIAFEKQGNSFTQISLKNIRLENNIAIADLFIKESNSRSIDKVVIKGYENLPNSFIKYRLNIKKTTVFNNDKLKKVSSAIKTIPFIEEIKPPQILFTKDSTHIYIYLKKKNANKFDGLIGFNSKENGSGLAFNGYLDLQLVNVFNYGEILNLLWKSNGDEKQIFKLNIEIPFIFGSPITTKIGLDIYRQDSTYVNLKSNLFVSYFINNQNRISGSIQAENSNLLISENSGTDLTNIDDYNSVFYGLSYQYQNISNDYLFPIKFYLNFTSLLGNRENDNSSTNQTKLTVESFYNLQLSSRNYFYFKNTSSILLSDDYLTNELFRIGGANDIRGFQEESINTSAFSVLNLEYRYLTNANSYLYTVTDFAYFENQLSDIKSNLYGFGLGYALNTKAGILNLSYVLGKNDNQPFNLSNATVHFKLVTYF